MKRKERKIKNEDESGRKREENEKIEKWKIKFKKREYQLNRKNYKW